MRFTVRVFLTLTLACSAATTIGADAFRVRLELDNGHLAQVFFGCREEATADYDPKIDIMAPPHGIATGYTVFVAPNGKHHFYRDMRSCASSVTWEFLAEVYKNNPITVAWDPDKLPENRTFRLQAAGGAPLDMRRKSKLVIEKTSRIKITAALKRAAGHENP